MSNFIKIGETVINKSAVLSASLDCIEYPTVVNQSQKGFLGLISALANRVDYEAREVKVLFVSISEGGQSKELMLYNDMDFHRELLQMMDNYGIAQDKIENISLYVNDSSFVRASDYDNAIYSFLSSLPKTCFVKDNLDSFLEKLVG